MEIGRKWIEMIDCFLEIVLHIQYLQITIWCTSDRMSIENYLYVLYNITCVEFTI